MDQPTSQPVGLQVVGGKQFKGGKGLVRIKPKHLRASLRGLAAAAFEQHQSAEDAAQSLDLPGITGKTVLECAVLNVVRRVERLEQLAMRGVAA